MDCIFCRAVARLTRQPCSECVTILEAVRRKLQSWRYAQANDVEVIRADPEESAVRVAHKLWWTDPEIGFAQFLALAERGSPWSMTMVGCAYESGKGTAADPVQAERWYRRAFECGMQQAQLRLGSIYASRHDLAACEKVYAVGAGENWAPAQYYLAWVKLQQPKTRANLESARLLLEQAAAAGDFGAQCDLAGHLLSGRFGIRRMPSGLRLAAKTSRKIKALAKAEAPAAESAAITAAARRWGVLSWLRRGETAKRNDGNVIVQGPVETVSLP